MKFTITGEPQLRIVEPENINNTTGRKKNYHKLRNQRIKEIYEIKSGKRNADIYKLFDAQTEFNNGFGN